MMKAVAMFSAVVMASVGVARADGSGGGEVEGEVDPAAAMALSLVGTAASYAAIAIGGRYDSTGLVVGGALGTLIMPSAGRWYAGSVGLSGMAIRGVGAAVAFAGAIEAFDACPWFGSGECDRGQSNLGGALVVLGGLAYAGGTIYDIVEAKIEADEHNAALRTVAAHHVALMPVVQPPQAGHAGSYGLSLAGQF